ncbi:class A beta-lactamase [Xylanimonas oleitrophica]|uniref:Beta-lactamase n=1 Tax=Xylanimonas oleitrophica TaxID=2607479 RepID=A0A2W5WQ62_9MICO|nr:class A beta-lactamase [Xylanimonas oleitrophica]PZR53477.1 class A beta-lactamase [Xylanimonas oleitrophica]
MPVPPPPPTSPRLRAPAGARRRALAVAVLTATSLTATSLTACAGPQPAGTASAGAVATADRTAHSAQSAQSAQETLARRDDLSAATAEAFAALEERFDARLGVHALDTGDGTVIEHRADERFAFASTMKALAGGLVLDRTGPDGWDEVVRYGAEDLVTYSPVTELHVDEGMTVLELVRASITVSDNTAANLLLDRLGGPQSLEAALHELLSPDGTATVPVSVDRAEPDLNDWAPGSTQDTATPAAMAAALRETALGDALRPEARAALRDALRDSTTGDALIRAGVPDGWVVGDKSGAGGHGTRNDIAVVERPDAAPLVLAVYSNRRTPDGEADPALVAEATRVVVDALAGRALAAPPG